MTKTRDIPASVVSNADWKEFSLDTLSMNVDCCSKVKLHTYHRLVSVQP